MIACVNATLKISLFTLNIEPGTLTVGEGSVQLTSLY